MKKRKFADGGIYTAEMGKPPQDIDGASVMPKPAMKRPMPKPAMKRPMPKPAMKRPLPAEAGAGDVTPPPGAPGMPGMKKGGSVSSRADGIAKKGKTNCKMY